MRDSLFIWIPRTGGTSIYKWLFHAANMRKYKAIAHRDSHAFTEFDNSGCVTFCHADLSLLVNQHIIAPEFYHFAYRFTIVRHPADRLVSHAARWQTKMRKLGHKLRLTNIISHCCRLIQVDRVPPLGIWNSRTRFRPYLSNGLQPMSRWLVRADGNLHADHVFKFGDLRAIANEIADAIGCCPPPADWHHHHKTRHPHFRHVLSATQLAILKEYYAEDYQRFGYD